MASMVFMDMAEEEEIEVSFEPFATPILTPGFTFPAGRQAANGERYGIDRDNDVYGFDGVMYGTVAQMAALDTFLNTYCRGPFKIKDIDGLYFPPNVSHAGTIEVAPMGVEIENRVAFAKHEDGVNTRRIRLRAVSPTFVSTSPSLAGLLLQHTFTQGYERGVDVVFAEAGNSVAVDPDNDTGLFVASFQQGTTATGAILRYLMETARVSPFAFPTISRVDYPFGAARGGLPKACKCIGVAVSRVGLNMWDVKLTLAESFEVLS